METKGCYVGVEVGAPVGHEPEGDVALAFVFNFEAEGLEGNGKIGVEGVFWEDFDGGAVDAVDIVLEEDGEEAGEGEVNCGFGFAVVIEAELEIVDGVVGIAFAFEAVG